MKFSRIDVALRNSSRIQPIGRQGIPTHIMRVLRYFALLLVALVLGLVCAQEEGQKERRQVVVRIVHVPPHCQSPDVRRSKKGDHMLVQFTGVILNTTDKVSEGQVFDTTRDTSHPYRFQLGYSGVMRGWEEA
ncbi:hypothetical protein EON63_15625 [archaeon]|nr:MAG: hypothetical protein EON63_15625 [archaeon]